MERKYALFFALAITAIIGINYLYFSGEVGSYSGGRERVVMMRALDGDTFDLADGRRVRMLNINTPEKGEFGASEALAYLKGFENKTLEIDVIGRETYGRLLARVYAPNYVNLEIVRNGLARTLLVQENEVNEFAKAQEDARDNELGMWEHSEYYDCLSGKIYKKEERVDFEKRCDVGLVGWTISDETTRKYTFKQEPADEFVFYSAEGEQNSTALFWKRGNAWNDDRDALSVRDSEGKLVYYSAYGY